MRNFKHWTPRYLANRTALAIYERQNPDHPWLTCSAVSILSSYLKETDTGLEWGSGRSTIWFAKRIRHLVSVEDTTEWYYKVKKELDCLQVDNVEYLLENNEESYIGVVDKFHNSSLDFVLVDGQSHRSTCAIRAVSKIKTGGLIIIDNANRFLPCSSHSPNSRTSKTGPASTEWQYFLDLVSDWRMIWTSNGVFDTAFFMKVTSY